MYSEKELCFRLGFSRKEMKAIRNEMQEGVHYARIKSNRPEHLWEVSWTEQGVTALTDRLSAKHATPEAPAEPVKIAEAPSNAEGTVAAKFKNPRIISVLIDGKTHNVLCRDSAKFGIGMPVSVKWDGAKWVVAKHPRFVGKY
jgi:hypothetical protein